MSVRTITATGTNLIASFSAKKIVAVSSNTGDTTQTVSAVGPVAGVGTTNTLALAGKVENISTNTYDSLSHLSLNASVAGSVYIRATGTAATGYHILMAQPANNDTAILGLTGFTQTYTFKAILTGAANEILIGAAASDTSTNLRAAINGSAGAGTIYGTGTVANTQLAATGSTTTTTLTDLIPCLRSLAWNCSVTGTSQVIINPANGVNGTLLATLITSSLSAYNTLTFNTESVSTDTLPALVTPTSDSMTINSGTFTIEAIMAAATDISWKVQTSTDSGVTWRDCSTTPSVITSTLVRFTPTEHANNIRVVITANANTAATKVNMKLID